MNDNEAITYGKQNLLTEDQKECWKLFADLVGGEHHMCGTVRTWGRGLIWNMPNSRLASFDFDGLTRLVLMAHDRCIRVEIQPSGPRMVGLVAHRRHARDGGMSERHPTMEAAIAVLRGTPLPEERAPQPQESPLAWLVFTPNHPEGFDYLVFPNEYDADCEVANDPEEEAREVVPLYRTSAFSPPLPHVHNWQRRRDGRWCPDCQKVEFGHF